MTELHLSDERLSARLDALEVAAPSDAPAIEEHLAACRACRERLEVLAFAKRLVATPVAPVPAVVRSQAVAAALAVGDLDGHGAPTDGGSADGASPAAARPMRPRWYHRPQVLVGAAAAAVLIAVGVAVPVALNGKSTSISASAQHHPQRSTTHGAASTLGPPRASSANPSQQGAASGSGASGATASPAASSGVPGAGVPSAVPSSPLGSSAPGEQSPTSLPELGKVSSTEQVLARLREYEASKSSSLSANSTSQFGIENEPATPSLSQCVASTRSASHAGAYGPGLVATATYRGHAAYVIEFWPTETAPPTGKGVVAVASEDGCHLLARFAT